MPAISKGDLILVTGASGFIAVQTVRELLRSGYQVRGTVRSKEKGEYLKDLFKGEAFDYAIVDDITKDGVFDESVQGVHAVAHTASPFHYNVTHPDELIHPALKGTKGMLASIQKNNPSIKRLVVTSSVASVLSMNSRPVGTKYTEEDWNEDSVPEYETKGKDCSAMHAYLASKTLAERAMWEFMEKERPSWDAATICPPTVFGEALQQVEKKSDLNTSASRFWAFASGSSKEEDLPNPVSNWVGVRDVAQAHVRALERPEAGGQRFIVCAGRVSGQHIVDILHKRYPELPNVPYGKPGSGEDIVKDRDLFVGTKATRVLGIEYQTLQDNIVEAVEGFKQKGWL